MLNFLLCIQNFSLPLGLSDPDEWGVETAACLTNLSMSVQMILLQICPKTSIDRRTLAPCPPDQQLY